MDFAFSDEQKDLRDLARKILEDKVTNERLKSVEARQPVFDRELWQELARSNLLGTAIPEAYGGAGFGAFELFLLLQEIGRAVAPVPALPALALGALPLASFGSDAQKQRWLPALASGEAIATAALTELDAPDPLTPGVTARREGAGFRLEGRKSSVPAGELAHCVLVPARLEDGRVAVFLLDPSTEGAAWQTQRTADRQPHAMLTLSGARVAEEDLLGSEEDGAAVLSWIVERATVALCAVELGLAERALEMTARYTSERQQFDRPIGSFQAVHQRAADAYVNVEALRLATWEAAWRLAEERPAGDTVAVAKYWACEAGHFVSYACTHLHGGIGIDVDYPLHRYFIWSSQVEHTLGPAPAQLAHLGARLAEGSVAPS
jgi:alkylation response protein AidB-like acyl-CoA dehydrogenase